MHFPDNRDPRWTPEIDAAINSKVEEAMALSPRMELLSNGTKQATKEERRNLLMVSFREIVKATSLDTLVCAPPALLEQLSVLALVNNENVKGILTQVIRVYMLLWGTPETNEYAQKLLVEMESVAREKLFGAKELNAERLKWTPLPC
jgi:hypothetical protein